MCSLSVDVKGVQVSVMFVGCLVALVQPNRFMAVPSAGAMFVLHGESITDQASPRTPTQRTFQPQEAVQPQRVPCLCRSWQCQALCVTRPGSAEEHNR